MISMKILEFHIKGVNFWDKLKALYWRLVGCNHPQTFVADLGDKDRGEDYFCFRCLRGF